MPEPLEQEFLETCDRFLAACQAAGAPMSESQFGRGALGDKNLLPQLRTGRSPTLRVVGRCLRFMQDQAQERGLPTPPTPTVARKPLLGRLRLRFGPFAKRR